MVPQLSDLSEEFFRVVDLGSGYLLICELGIPDFEVDVRLIDSGMQEAKLLQEVPVDVLHEYSRLVLSIQAWVEKQTIDFPIPVNIEEIEKFKKLSTPASEIAELDDSNLSQYQV